jgi:hypothetical protein
VTCVRDGYMRVGGGAYGEEGGEEESGRKAGTRWRAGATTSGRKTGRARDAGASSPLPDFLRLRRRQRSVNVSLFPKMDTAAHYREMRRRSELCDRSCFLPIGRYTTARSGCVHQ